MNVALPAAFSLVPIMLSAQGMHVHHAFQDVCNGYIYYDQFADSVVWSTGDVGYMLSDLAPGTYGFQIFEGGQMVDQGTSEVELVGWNFTSFNADPYLYPGLVMFVGTIEVPHCVGQIFDGVCCLPDPEQTTLMVFQDGSPYAVTEVPGQIVEAGDCNGCASVQCAYSVFFFLAEPGHAYTVGLNDVSCAGEVLADTTILAPSCANLELVTAVMDATSGQSNGSISLVDVIPDLTEPYPIQAPVTGLAYLIQLPEEVQLGVFEGVSSAEWTGLPIGEYLLVFMPDASCQGHSVVLQVGTSTALNDAGPGSGLRVFPTVADRTIALLSDGSGPIDLRIVDLHGREVVKEQVVAGSFPVDALVPGHYVIVAEQGGSTLRTRFIKR